MNEALLLMGPVGGCWAWEHGTSERGSEAGRLQIFAVHRTLCARRLATVVELLSHTMRVEMESRCRWEQAFGETDEGSRCQRKRKVGAQWMPGRTVHMKAEGKSADAKAARRSKSEAVAPSSCPPCLPRLRTSRIPRQ